MKAFRVLFAALAISVFALGGTFVACGGSPDTEKTTEQPPTTQPDSGTPVEKDMPKDEPTSQPAP